MSYEKLSKQALLYCKKTYKNGAGCNTQNCNVSHLCSMRGALTTERLNDNILNINKIIKEANH